MLIVTHHHALILSILEDQRSIAVQLREKDASQVNNQLEQLSFKVPRPFLPVATTHCVCCPRLVIDWWLTIDHVTGAWWPLQFETILDGTSQEVVFLKTCQELCDNALMGYNGTIFAYGQVGSLPTTPRHAISCSVLKVYVPTDRVTIKHLDKPRTLRPVDRRRPKP